MDRIIKAANPNNRRRVGLTRSWAEKSAIPISISNPPVKIIARMVIKHPRNSTRREILKIS